MQLRLFIYFFLLAATSVIAMHGRDDALEVLELKCEISVLHTYCPQSQPGTRLKRRMLGRRGPASVSDKLILLTGYERRKVMIQFDPSAAGTLPTTLKNYKLTSKEELENKVLSANRHRLILRPTLPVCATPELRTFLVGSYNKTTVNAVDADVINKPTARRSFSCIHILFVFCREIESRKRGVSFDPQRKVRILKYFTVDNLRTNRFVSICFYYYHHQLASLRQKPASNHSNLFRITSGRSISFSLMHSFNQIQPCM